jgi:hypothetical protein
MPTRPDGSRPLSLARRAVRGVAASLAALALGMGAATGLAACGEDREGGSVEQIGPDTTGATTGAVTGGTTTGGVTTGGTTTGAETDRTETSSQ